MPVPDLDLLTEAARAAGRIALGFWRKDPKVWDKGAEHGPVTEADLAVNDMLKTRLQAARPGYGWLSEETPDDTARLDSDWVFIIDPIDGTRAFVAGEENFAHSLAVAHRG
ncbi:MAG: 3'(2'),5'-bisphosphate nucleotidase CysQ, partial [Tabrizicola sp.]|nr:3'(2'),5'-bisphosphate nucleotidase CysQ [Tabrizicola sp.]